jgi:hypothetical protein
MSWSVATLFNMSVLSSLRSFDDRSSVVERCRCRLGPYQAVFASCGHRRGRTHPEGYRKFQDITDGESSCPQHNKCQLFVV